MGVRLHWRVVCDGVGDGFLFQRQVRQEVVKCIVKSTTLAVEGSKAKEERKKV